jgi:predicted Zn-dependent protease with MMP-like domain
MASKVMMKQELIMNFTRPPSADDILAVARQVMDILPDELIQKIEELDIQCEEFPDEATSQEMELDTSYDLLALYHSAHEIAPGVQKKVANGDDRLVLYRRPILDLWAETNDDLLALVREIMIEEMARAYEFNDADIQTMIKSHHQGLL